MASSQDDRITINTPTDGPVELVFGEASPEQRVECFKQTGRTFVRTVPESLWVKVEEELGQLPLLRGKGCRHWCLYKAAAPNEIVSSLRVVRRELLIRDDQGVRQETGYNVSFVATDVQYRGHGLASFLTRKVGEWADGPGAAALTTLYTGVGPFYVKLGWDLLPAPQVSFELPPGVSGDALQRKREEIHSLSTRLVGPQEMPDLCHRDIAQLRSQVEAYDLAPNTSLVTTLSIPGQLEWHQELANITNRWMDTGKEIKAVGAVCDEADTWILWYHYFLPKKLMIARVKIGYEDRDLAKQALVQLLRRAIEEAVSWEGLFTEVVIWDPSPEVNEALDILAKELGITTKSEMREANQTSVRWARAENRPTIFWPNESYAYS